MRLISARSVVRAHSGPPESQKRLSADVYIQGIECADGYLTVLESVKRQRLTELRISAGLDFEKGIGEKQIKNQANV